MADELLDLLVKALEHAQRDRVVGELEQVTDDGLDWVEA